MTQRTTDPQRDLWEIERSLQERVQRTREDYEHAMTEGCKLLQQARQGPDGIQAIRQARQLQQTATRRYSEALMALTSFVLDQRAG